MLLFAQRGAGAGGGDAAAGMGVAFFGMYCFFFLLVLGIQIMFLLSLSKCLKAISPRNRKMEPGQVWLALIPIFGFVWMIIMILRISESLENEFEDRGLRGDGDYGKTIGLVYIIGSLVCGPVGLVCWIMYWVKIAGFTKALTAGGGDYDDEDDRPRRKSRRDEEEDRDEEDDRPRRKKSRRDEEEDDDEDDGRGRKKGRDRDRDWS
jgi:hypothetical protein